MKADFEKIALNIAESIDATHDSQRPRARRIELIQHAVRRAILHGYKAGKNRNEAHTETNAKANGQANAKAATGPASNNVGNRLPA
jgi:hypothetical protein